MARFYVPVIGVMVAARIAGYPRDFDGMLIVSCLAVSAGIVSLAVRVATLRAIEGFFRLMIGDTSMIPKADLTPLDHVPTVDELLHGARR